MNIHHQQFKFTRDFPQDVRQSFIFFPLSHEQYIEEQQFDTRSIRLTKTNFVPHHDTDSYLSPLPDLFLWSSTPTPKTTVLRDATTTPRRPELWCSRRLIREVAAMIARGRVVPHLKTGGGRHYTVAKAVITRVQKLPRAVPTMAVAVRFS